jgi:uncharacterized membrane protein YfcA
MTPARRATVAISDKADMWQIVIFTAGWGQPALRDTACCNNHSVQKTIKEHKRLTKLQKSLTVGFGIVAGFINGFLGGGGGVIVVAVLLAVVGLPQKKSQATALLIILPLTVVSALVYIISGSVDWPSTLYATIGVVGGGVVGALLLNKINGNTAKLLFAIVLIVGGIKMLL